MNLNDYSALEGKTFEGVPLTLAPGGPQIGTAKVTIRDGLPHAELKVDPQYEHLMAKLDQDVRDLVNSFSPRALLPLESEHRWEIKRLGWGLWVATWIEEIEITPERESEGYDLSDGMAPLSCEGEMMPWTLSAMTRGGLERRMSRWERKRNFKGRRVWP